MIPVQLTGHPFSVRMIELFMDSTLLCAIHWRGKREVSHVSHRSPCRLPKGLKLISSLFLSGQTECPSSVHPTLFLVTFPVRPSETWRFLTLLRPLEKSLLATFLMAGFFFSLRSVFLEGLSLIKLPPHFCNFLSEYFVDFLWNTY